MSVKCLLDNCPHHAAQKGPLEIVGTVCQLKQCAWDAPTMTEYLARVNAGNPNPEFILPIGDQSCNSSQDENT